jgi:glycosyltransferase involved in cell wall biosynthesis
LPRSLTALVEQSVLPLEIIVIDDVSTDNSLQVIEEFMRRHPVVRLHRNEKNQGVIPNLNLGLQLIRGDYVLFAAADDEVMPGFMEKSAALLRKYPQAALCCTVGDWIELGTGLNWHVGVGMGDEPCYLPAARVVELERQSKLFIGSHSAIFRKAALLEVNGFIPELRWHCDWFAHTVIAFRYGICFVPEALSRQYIYPTSYSATGRKTGEHQRALRGILDLLLTPQYEDVEILVRKSGALFLFGWPILRLLLSDRAYRRFLNLTFLRKNLWHMLKLRIKRYTPAFLGNFYFKISGYRARKPKASTA